MLSAYCYTIFFAILIAIQSKWDSDWDDREPNDYYRSTAYKDARAREKYEKRWAEDDRIYRENMAKKRAAKDAKKAKQAENEAKRACGDRVRGDRRRHWPYGVRD